MVIWMDTNERKLGHFGPGDCHTHPGSKQGVRVLLIIGNRYVTSLSYSTYLPNSTGSTLCFQITYHTVKFCTHLVQGKLTAKSGKMRKLPSPEVSLY